MNYHRVYSEFIADRLNTQPVKPAYFERHHILPRSLGGGDEASNIIRLTAEDHIFAHLLLARAHESRDMWAAVKFIFGNAVRSCRSPNRRDIRIAAKAKEEFAKKNTGANNCNYGTKMSEESKRNLRCKNLGKKLSEDVKRRIGLSHLGKKHPNRKPVSEETKAKIAAAGLGRVHSDETRAKMSLSNSGRIFSDEHRFNISAAKKGKPVPHLHTEEVRKLNGLARRGLVVSEETRAKQSASRIGLRPGEYTRRKMSDARTGGGNPRAKQIICEDTGEKFSCMKDAAEKKNISASKLRRLVSEGNGRALVDGFNFRLVNV